jgi:hypothetical protein
VEILQLHALKSYLHSLPCRTQLNSLSWVEFYVTADGQPASLSWYKAPIWGLRRDLYYSYDNCGFFFLWGALSDERTGLTVIYAAGPCQRNLSLVRAPWVRYHILQSHIWDFPFRRLLRLAGSLSWL